MIRTHKHSRRAFLGNTAKLVLAGAVLPFAPKAMASLNRARSLAFEHTHTGEQLSLVYAVGDQYVPEALNALNHFLRDHYSGEIGRIDPALFDLLYRVGQELGANQPFQVISGYRCPQTNDLLRNSRGGGVAKHSLHMDGKAIDVRLPAVALSDLRDAALSLQVGGVGFYQTESFVHLDTGRVRTWAG